MTDLESTTPGTSWINRLPVPQTGSSTASPMPSERSDWGEAAFNPSSIALVGASAKSSKLGYILMRNLLEGYPGKLYPINPGETEIMGHQAYPRLLDVPGQVDL